MPFLLSFRGSQSLRPRARKLRTVRILRPRGRILRMVKFSYIYRGSRGSTVHSPFFLPPVPPLFSSPPPYSPLGRFPSSHHSKPVNLWRKDLLLSGISGKASDLKFPRSQRSQKVLWTSNHPISQCHRFLGMIFRASLSSICRILCLKFHTYPMAKSLIFWNLGFRGSFVRILRI